MLGASSPHCGIGFRGFSSASSADGNPPAAPLLQENEAAWAKRATKEIGGGDPFEKLTVISPEVTMPREFDTNEGCTCILVQIQEMSDPS